MATSNRLDLSKPLLMTSVADKWPCHSWTFKTLADMLGDKQFACRIAPKSCIQTMETQCSHQNVTIKQFCDWLEGSADVSNPLINFQREENSCYVDYKYMKDMFEDHPETFEEVQWKDFGLVGFDGYDSTIWLSSEGANTPGHQDTYGFNLITQIYGKKLWILFPPNDSQHLYPTRVPYEESSIFTEVNIRRPDLHSHSKFKLSNPVVVTLCAGQTLYVPRHWWHYVESLEPSISINVWVPMTEDRESHLSEAITRCLATSLITSLDTSEDNLVQSSWLNPTESLVPTSMNLLLLKTAVCQLLGTSCVREHSLMNYEHQDVQEDLSDTDELKQKGDHPRHNETKIVNVGDLEVKPVPDVMSDGGTKTTSNAQGSLDIYASCKDSVLTERGLAEQSDETSHQSLLNAVAETMKGHKLIQVDTPFQFDPKVELPINRTDDMQHGSSPKKCKFDPSVLNNSSINYPDFSNDYLMTQTSHPIIFAFSSCSFDSYLKYLDNICRQIQCRKCHRDPRVFTNVQLIDRNIVLTTASTETEISNVSSIDKPHETKSSDGNDDRDIRVLENVCHPFVDLTSEESCLNTKTLLNFHNKSSNRNDENSSNMEEKLILSDETVGSETSNESFVQLNQMEVAETLLACTLHPDVVKMISRLFQEQCQYRLRQKHIFK